MGNGIGVKKWLFLSVALAMAGLPAELFAAGAKIDIHVKTILASQGKKYFDPRLAPVIKDLQSVFKYTSYRLLRSDSIALGIGQSRSVSLEGDRSLTVTAIRIIGNRAELRLEISKYQKQIFQTRIQLLNNGSIIVGGPGYRDGYLLFSISNSF